jgi:hypothetical protein
MAGGKDSGTVKRGRRVVDSVDLTLKTNGKNLLGIKSKREMDQVEAQEQLRTLEELVRICDQNHRFTSADVRRIHKIWFGSGL